jgi:hypothetical protein
VLCGVYRITDRNAGSNSLTAQHHAALADARSGEAVALSVSTRHLSNRKADDCSAEVEGAAVVSAVEAKAPRILAASGGVLRRAEVEIYCDAWQQVHIRKDDSSAKRAARCVVTLTVFGCTFRSNLLDYALVQYDCCS